RSGSGTPSDRLRQERAAADGRLPDPAQPGGRDARRARRRVPLGDGDRALVSLYASGCAPLVLFLRPGSRARCSGIGAAEDERFQSLLCFRWLDLPTSSIHVPPARTEMELARDGCATRLATGGAAALPHRGP